MVDLHLHLDRAAGALSAQLAEQLRAGIRGGRLVPPTRLPSTRLLAGDLGLSRGVVVDAYEQLIAEGFLVSQHGSGTRVAPTPTTVRAADRTTAAAQPPAYDLRPGTPDLASFPRARWLATMRRTVSALPDRALAYPPAEGVDALRRELAGYLNRVRAAQAHPDRLVVTAGMAQGMAALGPFLAHRSNRPLAFESPSSAGSRNVLKGPDAVAVPIDEHGLDVDYLARTGAGAVVVTPAHQYPTGVVLAPERRTALVEWARANDALVIEDDYDAEFRYDRDPVGCLQGLAPDRVILLGTVSKSLAPALRLGWAVAPTEVGDHLRTYRAETDLGSPALDQYTLATFVADGSYDRHLRSARRTYRARRDALVNALAEHLPSARISGVSAGIHLYVELPGLELADEAALADAALERGVAVGTATATRFGDHTPPRYDHPALVLGYAQLAGRHLADAARRLADAYSVIR